MCVVRLAPQPCPGSGFKRLHLEASPATRQHDSPSGLHSIFNRLARCPLATQSLPSPDRAHSSVPLGSFCRSFTDFTPLTFHPPAAFVQGSPTTQGRSWSLTVRAGSLGYLRGLLSVAPAMSSTRTTLQERVQDVKKFLWTF